MKVVASLSMKVPPLLVIKLVRGLLLRCCLGFGVLLNHHLAEAFHFCVGWQVGGLAVLGALPREGDPFGGGLGRLALFHTHAVVDLMGHESRLFPALVVAGIVASDDALHLPPSQVEEKLMSAESYLAHEQLVKFVGGG